MGPTYTACIILLGLQRLDLPNFLPYKQAKKTRILLVQGKPANMRVPNKQDPLSLGLSAKKRTTYLGLIMGLSWSLYLWTHTTTGGGETTPHPKLQIRKPPNPCPPNPTTQCPNRRSFFCYLGLANCAEYL